MANQPTRTFTAMGGIKTLCFCSVSLCVVMLADASEARRQLIPQKPSVEVNLEVLRDLEAIPFASKPKGMVSHRGIVAPSKGRSGLALPQRRVPLMNRGQDTAPSEWEEPKTTAKKKTPAHVPFKKASAPLPKQKLEAKAEKEEEAKPVVKAKVKPKPKPQAEPKKEVVALEPSKAELPPLEAEPKPSQGGDPFFDAPMPAPAVPTPSAAVPPALPMPLPEPSSSQSLPDIAKLSDPEPPMFDSVVEPAETQLPDPDFGNMNFDDFPALAELPPVKGDAVPSPDLPMTAPDMPPLPGQQDVVPMPTAELPPVAAPAVPVPEASDMVLPPAVPLPDPSAMPLPSPTEVPLMAPKAPLPPPGLPPAQPPMVEMPPVPGVVGDSPTPPKMPDIGPLTKDVVALPGGMPPPPGAADSSADELMASLPPLDAPEVSEDSGKVLVSIEYPQQETQVPVTMQKKLSELSKDLIQKDQSIRILGIAGGTADTALAARRAAYSRAMLVRAFLIDKGMNHFNINISTRPAGEGEKSERVDVVVQ